MRKTTAKLPGCIPTTNHFPNQIPIHGKNKGNNEKCEGECPSYLQLHGESNACVNNRLGMYFPAFTCPRSQENVFPKMGNSPNSKLTSIPFPSQGNNFLHKFYMAGHKRQKGWLTT